MPRRDRSVRRSAEWRQLKQDLGWWADHRPDILVAFVRGAHELLAGGGWGGGAARSWAEAPWRRSAVAYLQVRPKRLMRGGSCTRGGGGGPGGAPCLWPG